MGYLCLLLPLFLAATAWSKFVLQPGPFLKLPDRNNRYTVNNGAANKASYDNQENYLYVIGYKADLLHIVNMTDPNTPQLIASKYFQMVNMGLPDSVKVCRGGTNREFLAISFESVGQLEKSHVYLFQLFDSTNYDGPLVNLKAHATVEGFDPRDMGWKRDCSELLVLSEGNPHEVNGIFTDPPATMDILIPSFGNNVDKITVPIIESDLEAANVRYIFQQCEGDGDSTERSSRVQDLEPKAVYVDRNDIAFVVFQDNNAMGTLNMSDPFAKMQYYDLGRKDWSSFGLDGSYDDGGLNLKSRMLQSFYQPRDLDGVYVDGKLWLVTADAGSIRKYSLSSCSFDESSTARNWNQPFADGLTAAEVQQLDSDMNSNAEIGRLSVSKLRQSSDGWDSAFQGYDFVCTYGGRGFSIIDPATMSRVFDSGDDFERYYTSLDATEPQKAIFNAKVGGYSTAQSSQVDRASPEQGPQPSNIAVVQRSA
ncbi:uncharacterized protein [Littorina saxatilis]|uniref:uncharacterized protein isoform X2 n=1 Tax=Littorina saxatilis TaxID=31220 RepID=UPI0038B59D96